MMPPPPTSRIGATRESTPPNVLRTHDYGKSWQKIVTGFPADEMVRVVREDPKRKGLLYAGTDTTVFVSWDDGDHWQPLTLNLPPTPITDLQVHDNDLADLDLRPLAVDPGRRDAAARDEPEDRCFRRSSVPSRDCHARALGQL